MSGKNSGEKEILEEKILQEIDFSKLNELRERIADAICEILDSCGLYFRIFSRVKTVESIAQKLIRGKYGTGENPKKLQDLIGIRVVLYYYDDLSICRDIMEDTFQMVDAWSKSAFNADEFRATKINGVFKFPMEYFGLYKKELWKLPIDTTFEIQFRTVFFEGWHEIEHDMRYKSLLSDDQFWKGSEELSRILNCILASLELSDWTLVQLFDQLSYNHYKKGNWELMLKSKFRIKMENAQSLHPDIVEIFNSDREVAKMFFKCSRRELIRELLTLDRPNVTYNLIIMLLNRNIVQNPKIAKICANMELTRDEPAFQKTTLARFESDTLFKLDIFLLHKDARKLSSEFNNASLIIYKWARFKLNSVFGDMPETMSSYENRLPGYDLIIEYSPEKMEFSMDISYIDSTTIGTLWHLQTRIMPCADKENKIRRLKFIHVTSRNMPKNITRRPTFKKPSFLAEISNKVGLEDVFRLCNYSQFVARKHELTKLIQLIQEKERRLPVVAITQRTDVDETSDSSNSYRDGYDMNTFYVNGMRLAKVVGTYAHVYMIDKKMAKKFTKAANIAGDGQDGCICIFWPAYKKKDVDIFTGDMICDAQFDFNRFAFHDMNIYEKAFRHKLVQVIKDDNAQERPDAV